MVLCTATFKHHVSDIRCLSLKLGGTGELPYGKFDLWAMTYSAQAASAVSDHFLYVPTSRNTHC